jgi:hypothetical protein
MLLVTTHFSGSFFVVSRFWDPKRLPFGKTHIGIANQGPTPATGREEFLRIQMSLRRQPDLLEIIAALHSSRGFAGGLNGGKEQGNQNADDGDNDQNSTSVKPRFFAICRFEFLIREKEKTCPFLLLTDIFYPSIRWNCLMGSDTNVYPPNQEATAPIQILLTSITNRL